MQINFSIRKFCSQHGISLELRHVCLKARQQLRHNVGWLCDLYRVAVAAHRLTRQLVDQVKVHGLCRDEIVKGILDRTKHLVGVAFDDAVAKLLEALESRPALLEACLRLLRILHEIAARL